MSKWYLAPSDRVAHRYEVVVPAGSFYVACHGVWMYRENLRPARKTDRKCRRCSKVKHG